MSGICEATGLEFDPAMDCFLLSFILFIYHGKPSWAELGPICFVRGAELGRIQQTQGDSKLFFPSRHLAACHQGRRSGPPRTRPDMSAGHVVSFNHTRTPGHGPKLKLSISSVLPCFCPAFLFFLFLFSFCFM